MGDRFARGDNLFINLSPLEGSVLFCWLKSEISSLLSTPPTKAYSILRMVPKHFDQLHWLLSARHLVFASVSCQYQFPIPYLLHNWSVSFHTYLSLRTLQYINQDIQLMFKYPVWLLVHLPPLLSLCNFHITIKRELVHLILSSIFNVSCNLLLQSQA